MTRVSLAVSVSPALGYTVIKCGLGSSSQSSGCTQCLALPGEGALLLSGPERGATPPQPVGVEFGVNDLQSHSGRLLPSALLLFDPWRFQGERSCYRDSGPGGGPGCTPLCPRVVF